MITPDERNYLLKSLKELLTEYEYPSTDSGLNKIIDEWATQKATLIEAFKKHPHYRPGMFMIAFDSDYEREVDPNVSYNFSRWIFNNAMAQCKESLPDEIKARMASWQMLPSSIFGFINELSQYAERCISEETAEYLNAVVPEIHAHAGQKTSRIVNKLCCYLGYDKVPGYNKEFAKYADSLSPMIIKRHTVLSINPLDYLTMSFGNSWASCHTIDKTNKRDMPNSYAGQYSSGTMSYMLDSTSMVLYTVDGSYKGDEYWNEPKITRQMFHWGQEKLIQGRLYPQDNDGLNSVYTPYRNIVQQIISTIFEFPNLWSLKKGSSEAGRYINSCGTHYRDYYYFGSCNLSRVKGSENENMITVGADPICPNCGNKHILEYNISCCGGGGLYHCAHCGEELYGDDAIEINGRYYCRDCVYWCEDCQSYHYGDVRYLGEYERYVCDDCLNEYYVYCDDYEAYVRKEDAVYDSTNNKWTPKNTSKFKMDKCARCGDTHNVNKLYWYRGRYYCEECYHEEVNGLWF